MADLINQISGGSPDTVALLLQAMGQTGGPAAGQAPAVDLMNPTSLAAVQALLTNMGQTTSPAAAPAPLDPMFLATGEFGQGNMNQASVEAVRAMLGGMGQTGSMQTSPSAPGATVTPGTKAQAVTTTSAAQANAEIAADVNKSSTDAFYREMTGVANTDGGAARVNQYTKTHGVTAVTDPKTGRVTLTNIDPVSGNPTPESQKQVYGFAPLSRASTASVNALMTSLKQTADPDKARGIMSSLNESLAIESARLEAEANKFAENKLGIPAMEQNLARAEALDKITPGYIPGMGDSKNTAAIRQGIYVARNNAQTVAKNWLESNIGYAQLKAAATNAQSEVARMTRLSDKTQAKADAVQAKTDAVESAAIAASEGLSVLQKEYILQLNPGLRSIPDNRAEMVRFADRQMKNDPSFKALMNAAPEDVPMLAVSGNQHATAVLVQEEVTKTGKSPAQVTSELRQIQELAKNPNTIKDYSKQRAAALPVGERKAAEGTSMAEYNTLRMGTSKESKAKASEYSLQAALSVYRQRKTAVFVNDVTTWGSNDPELLQATNVAFTQSGSRDIASVVTAYVGDLTGPAALAKYNAFKQKISTAAAKEANSAFGGIDTSAAMAQVDQQAKEYGAVAKWFKNRWGEVVKGAELGMTIAPTQGVIDASGALWGAFQPTPLDPSIKQ